jgi:hypothetical protein
MLANLREHDPLTQKEEERILHAIESAGVQGAAVRLIAQLSANTLRSVLEKI